MINKGIVKDNCVSGQWVGMSNDGPKLAHYKYSRREGSKGNYRYYYDNGDEHSSAELEPNNKDEVDAINSMYDLTGMKKGALHNLINIAKRKGFDSKEYQDEAFGLAEGDPETAKKITAIIKNLRTKNLATSSARISAKNKNKIKEHVSALQNKKYRDLKMR